MNEGKLVIGQPFSPHMRSFGPIIPLGIMSSQRVKEGPKLLLARLYMYAGKGDRCHPSVSSLAKDLAVSKPTTERWLGELVKHGFVGRKRTGLKSSGAGGASAAECIMIWHSDLVSSLRNAPSDPSKLMDERDDGTLSNPSVLMLPSIKTDGSDPSNLWGAYKEEENQSLESLRESAAAVVEVLSNSAATEQENAAADGDDLFEEPKPTHASPGTSLALSKKPAGEFSPEELDAVEQAILTSGVKLVNLRHPSELLGKCYERSLKLAVLLAFIAWKTKDGRIQTSSLLVKAVEQNDIDQFMQSKSGKLLALSLEAERQDNEEKARKKRQMETPVSLDEALNRLRDNFQSPEQLVAFRLKRRNVDFISPSEILRMNRELLSIDCEECRRSGTTGSALTATLAFCGCRIGRQEAQDLGESFLEAENAKVNADLKTRMIAVSRELGNQFTADALERATFSEKPDRVDISVQDQDLKLGAVTNASIRAAALRIGEARTIGLWDSAGYRPCQYCSDTGRYRSGSYGGMKACWSCEKGNTLEDIPDAPITPIIPQRKPAKITPFAQGVKPFTSEAELRAAADREQASSKGNQ
jgi:hypothetical protein